jgi:hypothetical protein
LYLFIGIHPAIIDSSRCGAGNPARSRLSAG